MTTNKKPEPKERTEQITVPGIPAEDVEWLTERATEEDRSVASVVRDIIRKAKAGAK